MAAFLTFQWCDFNAQVLDTARDVIYAKLTGTEGWLAAWRKVSDLATQLAHATRFRSPPVYDHIILQQLTTNELTAAIKQAEMQTQERRYWLYQWECLNRFPRTPDESITLDQLAQRTTEFAVHMSSGANVGNVDPIELQQFEAEIMAKYPLQE